MRTYEEYLKHLEIVYNISEEEINLKIKGLEDKVETLSDTINSITKENNNLKLRNDGLEALSKQNKKEIEQLESKLKSTELELTKEIKNIEQLKRELKEVTTLKQKQFDEFNKKIDTLKQKHVDELSLLSKEKNDSISSLNEKIKKQKEEIDTLKENASKNTASDKEIWKLTSELEHYKKLLEDSEKKFADEIKFKEKIIRELKQKIDEIEKGASNSSTVEWKLKLSKVEDELNNLNLKIRTKETEIQGFKEKLSNEQKKFREFTVSYDKSTKVIESLEKQLNENVQKNKELEERSGSRAVLIILLIAILLVVTSILWSSNSKLKDSHYYTEMKLYSIEENFDQFRAKHFTTTDSNVKFELNNEKFTYTGEIVNKKPHGQGVAVYDNRDRYEGSFREGKRYGFGEYIVYESGMKIIGKFENTPINNRCKFYDRNGRELRVDGR